MKLRKTAALVIAVLLTICTVPVFALAESSAAVFSESVAAADLNTAWAAIERAESIAVNSGLSKKDVIAAVQNAALNIELVDADSMSDFTEDGFFFTVDGMYCAYNYRLRNELDTENAVPVPEDELVTVVKGTGNGAVRDAESPHVLLVGPYYGHDANFTDQYKNESLSIAEATGGDRVLLQSTGATGPAIAENYPDKGVVIYDSHGTQSGSSSYLCLTTNSGILQSDYSNGWAVNTGSAAYIDGRYIQHHVANTLSNCFVWMAICEGMKRQGQGTTGYALLEAGAGAVYGYSQSVTFAGDYLYEEVFWNVMKDEGTAKQAYEEMIEVYGIPDPYGSSSPAYPILMSPVDDFPTNPDGPQTVNCEWTLYGFMDDVALESFSLSESELEIYQSYDHTVDFVRVPENANQYQLVWSTDDDSVLSLKGNNRRCKVLGIAVGTANLICTVFVDGQPIGTAECAVTVKPDTSLDEALNVENGSLHFTSSEEHPFRVENDGERFFARSGNGRIGNSVSSLFLSLNMHAGDTLSFEYRYGAEQGYDYYNFKVNGTQVQHLTGSNNNWANYVYTASADGTYTFEWSFVKDPYMEEDIDAVWLDNIAFSGESTPVSPDGDVDGDGEVTVTDALIVMRAAMGIIDYSEDMLAHGDVDESGELTISDALLILRSAMGI